MQVFLSTDDTFLVIETEEDCKHNFKSTTKTMKMLMMMTIAMMTMMMMMMNENG